MSTLYRVHASLEGDVRFIFESITGMQELWGKEDLVSGFYSHSCPRLYELNTIAYWIMEKKAHSHRLKAQINHIAQVAIDLSIKRGTTSLSIIKAENRSLENLQGLLGTHGGGLARPIGIEEHLFEGHAGLDPERRLVGVEKRLKRSVVGA